MSTSHPEFAEARYLWWPPQTQHDGKVKELLIGELQGGETRKSDHGEYPSVVFELTENQVLTVREYRAGAETELRQLSAGDTVRLNVLGTVLNDEFAKALVKRGMVLKVAYLGKLGTAFTDPVIWRVRQTGGSFNPELLFGAPAAAPVQPDIPGNTAELYRSLPSGQPDVVDAEAVDDDEVPDVPFEPPVAAGRHSLKGEGDDYRLSHYRTQLVLAGRAA